jgi:hypothetical protein
MPITPHEISPNIGNLSVGRGFCQFKLIGETSYVDCGNVTEMTYQVKPTLLEHYSSRIGVRKKDLVVVTELAATLTVSMEEFTARNMAFAALGVAVESPPGTYTIDMFTTPLIQGSFLFTATNVVGPIWSAEFPLVIFSPSKPISLISAGSGSWGLLDFQADILQDPHTGQFGIFTNTDIASP